MSDSLYRLRWNNHHASCTFVFYHLFKTGTFTDVTLACEDASIQCHKIVLAASSLHFRDMLMGVEECPHPIVVLKDLKLSEVETLLEYMYNGEVKVEQHQIPGLLKAAQMLKVKGLWVDDEDGCSDWRISYPESLCQTPCSSISTPSPPGTTPRLFSTPSPPGATPSSFSTPSPPGTTPSSFSTPSPPGTTPSPYSTPSPPGTASNSECGQSSSTDYDSESQVLLQLSNGTVGLEGNARKDHPKLKKRKQRLGSTSGMYSTPTSRTRCSNTLSPQYANGSTSCRTMWPEASSYSQKNYIESSDWLSSHRLPDDFLGKQINNSSLSRDAESFTVNESNTLANIKNDLFWTPRRKKHSTATKFYKRYPEKDMISAVEAVRSGMSAIRAARTFNIPSRTLYDKVKKMGVKTKLPPCSLKFSKCPVDLTLTISPYEQQCKTDSNKLSS